MAVALYACEAYFFLQYRDRFGNCFRPLIQTQKQCIVVPPCRTGWRRHSGALPALTDPGKWRCNPNPVLLQFCYIGVLDSLNRILAFENKPSTYHRDCQIFKDKFNRTVNCHLKKRSTCLPGARRLNPGSGSSWKSLQCYKQLQSKRFASAILNVRKHRSIKQTDPWLCTTSPLRQARFPAKTWLRSLRSVKRITRDESSMTFVNITNTWSLGLWWKTPNPKSPLVGATKPQLSPATSASSPCQRTSFAPHLAPGPEIKKKTLWDVKKPIFIG